MGRASAVRFVEEGARVVVADISGAERETADELGTAAVAVHCDVSSEDDVVEMFATALREFGRVDSVLNVAGVFGSLGHGIDETAMSEYDAILDVDLRGVVHGTKHGIRAMDGHGGTILNWSSVAGLNVTLHTGVYSAAKAGVIALTRATAAEYGDRNIRANSICPGIVSAQDLEALGDVLTPEMLATVAEQTEAGARARRTGRPGGRPRRVPRVRPGDVHQRIGHHHRRRLVVQVALNDRHRGHCLTSTSREHGNRLGWITLPEDAW